MATGKEWESHFKVTFNPELEKLVAALQTLQQDELFYKEFKSSGIFNLIYFINEELMKRQ